MSPSSLRRLARRSSAPAGTGAQVDEGERCDLCGEAIPAEHRHVVDLASRELKCACRACALLFDSSAAGGGHFRAVPDRRLLVEDFELDDADWAALRIPVDMAFFFHSTPAERVSAFYPSPAGATESLLELDAWRGLESNNPVLAGLRPDVEALLVNRARGERSHWVVPIDDCYALVGLMRTGWRGLSGGQEVWREIDRFFDELGRRARRAGRDGTVHKRVPAAAMAAARKEEETWQTT